MKCNETAKTCLTCGLGNFGCVSAMPSIAAFIEIVFPNWSCPSDKMGTVCNTQPGVSKQQLHFIFFTYFLHMTNFCHMFNVF